MAATSIGQRGLLIDYYYCSGCRSCEVACKNEQELGAATKERGIKVLEIGPWELADGRWVWNFMPTPTDLCDLCADRVANGDAPSCVLHCLAQVITYGSVEELAKKMESSAISKSRQSLFLLE